VKTELKNRTLWFDGTSQVSPELVPELLLEGVQPSRIVVTEPNDDIDQFNALVDEVIEFGKDKNRPFDMSYRIPRDFLEMDLEDYVFRYLEDFIEANPKDEKTFDLYYNRVKVEMQEIRLRGMEPLVKTLVYVIDKLAETETFWGVGRGSSCASLVLFLIRLHKVDPIKYGIPMGEFFHD
jgi:DNA polymerase III alpha subunit